MKLEDKCTMAGWKDGNTGQVSRVRIKTVRNKSQGKQATTTTTKQNNGGVLRLSTETTFAWLLFIFFGYNGSIRW
jgi:hypothetical protein